MPALYRTYRPQTFADVVGQPHITRTISAAILGGRVAHAYLLAGPRGVGKTTTARLLAKAVNCEGKKEEGKGKRDARPRAVPCNACDRCTEITEGKCMDVVEIDAASHTGVDHVREHIIEAVRFAPARAQRKVFIIDEVHMLSGGAFNALLKTIEEPPDHALFILATTELHKVPETIRSRCQLFTFRRVAQADLTARLRNLAAAEGVEVDGEVFDAIARAADGSVRDAESMLGQVLALSGKRISVADAAFVLPRSSIERAGMLVRALGKHDGALVLAEIQRAEEEGFDAEAYVRDVISVLRETIVTESGNVAGAADRIGALRAFAGLMETIGRSDRPFFALEVAALSVLADVHGDVRSESSQRQGHPNSGAGPRPGPPAAREEAGHGGDLARREHGRAAPIPQRHETSVVVDRPQVEASPRDVPGAQTLERIRAAWGTLIMNLAEINRAIPYLLEGGRPQCVVDGVFTIGFRYKLHAEKVRQPNVLDVVARAVCGLTNTTLRVATVVVSMEEFTALDAAVRPQTGDAVADAALEVFGGRVVE